MSRFVLAFDVDQQKDVLAALKTVRGVVIASPPAADGTLVLRTTTRTLDDETAAIRSVEDIPGVIDLRLLD
ncbi:MAG: hypothetical protein HS108_02875 [Planctomycetes bacterium]|nr:hypothetical protein [Planctomycetota bacterium]MCL4730977.1 hypothetical protein [Planctomycetota bacterium]